MDTETVSYPGELVGASDYDIRHEALLLAIEYVKDSNDGVFTSEGVVGAAETFEKYLRG